MKRLSLLITLLLSISYLHAQINFNDELVFGNEWLDHDKEYAKFFVSEDQVYKIQYSDLVSAGLPDDINGKDIQLFSFGKQVPIYVSTFGQMSGGDFVEFFGLKNRGELESHLYEDPVNDQLNPDYSIFTDDRPYYITWEENSPIDANARYEEVNNSLGGNLPSVERFYRHEEKIVFSDQHIQPLINAGDVRYSNFYTAEGYGSKIQRENTVSLPATSIVRDVPTSKLKFRFGTVGGNHRVYFTLNGEFVEEGFYFAYDVEDKEYEILTEDLKNTTVLSLEGQLPQSDNNTIASASLIYPRSFEADNEASFRFSFPAHSFPKYFEINNFNGQGNPVLYDLTNQIRLESEYENGVLKFLLPRADVERDIVIVNVAEQISEFERIDFVDYSLISPEYVILTSKALDNNDSSGENHVRAYADFRSSEVGGGYQVEIIYAEDIIDQFGYGVKNHTLGIKNWSNFHFDKWLDWEFTFIIGKAYEYSIIRDEENLVNHIPTYGEPGSDVLNFSKDTLTYPEVAIGRLAAKSFEEVELYLDKMKVYTQEMSFDQSIDGKAWQKRIIHLSGGTANIQDDIRSHLGDMEDVIENSTFGAEVTTFQKTTSDPVQNSISQGILDAVNNGCAVMTFFGHSSVGTFDFSVEDPSQFDNEGKTPLIISLGCHSGNIHTNSSGISEDFVLTPEKGAIAFLAASGSAFIDPQFRHGESLYEMVGDSLYGKAIGTSIKNMLKANTNNSDFQILTLQQQLTLHGDPALVIREQKGPDYTPDLASFRTVPEIVSGRLDSIDVCFDIINLGYQSYDTISYYLIHKFSNKKDTFFFNSTSPFFRKNLCHTIPINTIDAAGENIIEVYLDHENKISELPNPGAELNNSILDSYQVEGYSFFVLNDNPIPFSPPEFSITNKDALTLIASTGNGFVGKSSYEIEIDSTELFNSPIKQSALIESNGGLVKWQPNITYENEIVYYWRVKAADPEFGLSYWNNSSFVHMDEFENGWNQSHVFQFQKDKFQYIRVDSTSRDFKYEDAIYEYAIDVQEVNNILGYETEFKLNSSRLDGEVGSFIGSGVMLLVIDPNSLQPIVAPLGSQFGQVDIGAIVTNASPRVAWRFRTSTEQERQNLLDFLNNQVPEGFYVAMATIQSRFGDYKPEEWSDELFGLFESHGANLIRETIGNPRPYSFSYQKGGGALQEVIAPSSEDRITAVSEIVGRWFEGNIYSTTIGPAANWNTMYWDFDDFDQSEDLFNIRLLGIKSNNEEDTLAASILNKEYDLSTIDANQYPNIRLELFTRDTVSFTSLDLDFWRVVFKPLPEAILNTSENFVFQSDTLQQGDMLNLEYLIENVSGINMDSMYVKYSIFDRQNTGVTTFLRKAPVQAEKSISDQFTYDTSDLSGLYELRVEINPDKDQPEQYDFNNLGVLQFLVRSDNINPILDVTFDGIRILDGDIVSPKPLIKVSLSDENLNLLIDDIDDFQLVLADENGNNKEEIDLNGPNVNFIPATPGDSNVGCIEFMPSLTEGGYILFVQGKDASGNFSGDHEYAIRFTVIEENLISNVLNYPNPFSNSTQFIFTLTGDQVPTSYHIKVMTLSGKVVKEITQDDLGPIRVGINRSEYRWDGRDDYGSNLANGVYLYKFYTDLQEELDEFKLDSVDQFFKEGFGKLVIIK